MGGGDAAGVNQRLPIALTIAGSDSGGGAGIQADLKTFASLGVYSASVITALTAQDTRGVHAIHYAPPGIVRAQIEAILEDFAIAAIKIGMLGNAETAAVVAQTLSEPSLQSSPPSPSRAGRPPERPLGRGGETILPPGFGPGGGPKGRMRAFIVYDPVMAASSGDPLSGADFVGGVRHALLPLVDCLTPNLAEAATLLGEPIAQSEADMARQGEALLKLGPRAVLMKGGHLDSDEAIDLLVTEDAVCRFAAPRLASKNLHGTGCVLSSAIAAYCTQGAPLSEAVERAKAFVRQAIVAGRDLKLGSGVGPLRPDLVASVS
jgi:hydroxymethylpyrimidine/phosphomethylpyrimidine kinase